MLWGWQEPQRCASGAAGGAIIALRPWRRCQTTTAPQASHLRCAAYLASVLVRSPQGWTACVLARGRRSLCCVAASSQAGQAGARSRGTGRARYKPMQPCARAARPGARRLRQSSISPRCPPQRPGAPAGAGALERHRLHGRLPRLHAQPCRVRRSEDAGAPAHGARDARGLQARRMGCSAACLGDCLAAWYARLAMRCTRLGPRSPALPKRMSADSGSLAASRVRLPCNLCTLPHTVAHGRGCSASVWGVCIDSISGLGVGRRRWWRCCTRAASAGCPLWTPASRSTRATRPTRQAWRPASSSPRRPTRRPTPARRAPAARRPATEARAESWCSLARHISP